MDESINDTTRSVLETPSNSTRGCHKTIRVIDSHTEGEPTRVIVEGAPFLGNGTLAERAKLLSRNHQDFCRASLLEPRGHDAIVGAVLCTPSDPSCVAGVIYYNTVGNLGMCGHASIGTAVVLAYMGRISLGVHRFETPVGIVSVDLKTANTAVLDNVESYRYLTNVSVDVDGLGQITGDIAWGGNWFFLVNEVPCSLHRENIAELTHTALAIRRALARQGFSGADGSALDHVEFNGPPASPDADGRNFVLCPGGAYDRSPCGTGTSAKIACLVEDGVLKPDDTWVQESIIGSRYSVSYRVGERSGVICSVAGSAFVCAESTLICDPSDPYVNGISHVVQN